VDGMDGTGMDWVVDEIGLIRLKIQNGGLVWWRD
jgi:hypothetical protein